MKYMIIQERGNGYHCGCCRRTYEGHEIMEFDNDEECKSYVESSNKSNYEDRWNMDCQIVEVHQMFGESKQIV